MSARFGLLGGFLGLTALEAILSTKGSASRVSGLLGTAATVFEHLTDPSIPAIGDHTASADLAETGSQVGVDASSAAYTAPPTPAPSGSPLSV